MSSSSTGSDIDSAMMKLDEMAARGEDQLVSQMKAIDEVVERDKKAIEELAIALKKEAKVKRKAFQKAIALARLQLRNASDLCQSEAAAKAAMLLEEARREMPQHLSQQAKKC